MQESTKENRIYLYNPKIEKNVLTCFYQVEGEWTSEFPESHWWTIVYPEPLGKVPNPILMKAFLYNIMAAAWAWNAQVVLPYAGEDADSDWQKYKTILQNKFPELTLGGSLTIGQTMPTEMPENLKPAILCMQEDVTLKLLAEHAAKRPELCCVYYEHSNPQIQDYENRWSKRMSALAGLFGCRTSIVRASFEKTIYGLLSQRLTKEQMRFWIGQEVVQRAAFVPYLYKKQQFFCDSEAVRAEDLDERRREIEDYEKAAGVSLLWKWYADQGETRKPSVLPEDPSKFRVWILGVPEHRNLGDHQIVESVREFLLSIQPNLRMQEVSLSEYEDRKHELQTLIREEDVLVFLGGGFFGNLWPKGDELRRDAFVTWPKNRKIVFPQSIFYTEDPEGAKALSEAEKIFSVNNAILTFRDPVSSEFAEEHFGGEQYLTPDIVMYSDRRKASRGDKRSGALLLLRDDRERQRPEEADTAIETALQQALGAETAIERGDMALLECIPATARKIVLHEMIEKIGSKRIVVTDRLHGLLFCAITETPCVALGNSYHKIAAYASWLTDLPYLRIVSSMEEIPAAIEQVLSVSQPSYPLDVMREKYQDFRQAAERVLAGAEKKRQAAEESRAEEPLVSVIVPVYNTQSYLTECLKSVLEQTYPKFEVVCVDDGSTDDSAKLLQEFAAKDARIRVLTQPNGGLSAARNTGMKAARGKYLCFLDSDDALEQTALEELVRKAEQDALDLVLYTASVFGSPDCQELVDRYHRFYFRQFVYEDLYSGAGLMELLQKRGEYLSSACLYLVRREFLLKHELTFIEGILHEDNPFTFEVLLTASRAGVLDRAFYRRRVAGGSIVTSGSSLRHVEGYLRGYLAMNQFLQTIEGLTDSQERSAFETAEKVLRLAQREYQKLEDPNCWKTLRPWMQGVFRRLILDSFELRGKELARRKNELDERLQITFREKAERGETIKTLREELQKRTKDEKPLLKKVTDLKKISRHFSR